MYNSCIDADNLLYPYSNYRRCFIPENTLYFCNKAALYTRKQKELCENFILPSFATDNLQTNVLTKDKYYCEDFENKIIKHYDDFIKDRNQLISNERDSINSVNTELMNNHKLELATNQLLNLTTTINHDWLTFYPKFQATFKIRSNLTDAEFTALAKMRDSFDFAFPFAATLNRLSQDAQFQNADFSTLSDSIVQYYIKGEQLFSELQKNFLNFDHLVNFLIIFSLT